MQNKFSDRPVRNFFVPTKSKLLYFILLKLNKKWAKKLCRLLFLEKKKNFDAGAKSYIKLYLLCCVSCFGIHLNRSSKMSLIRWGVDYKKAFPEVNSSEKSIFHVWFCLFCPLIILLGHFDTQQFWYTALRCFIVSHRFKKKMFSLLSYRKG